MSLRAELAAQRALVAKRTTVRRRPQRPLGIAAAYERALLRASRDMAAAAKRIVDPYLADLRASSVRTDATVGLDLARLRVVLLEIGDRAAREHVETFGNRISDWSQTDLAAVLGVDLQSDPLAVQRVLDRWRRQNVALIRSIARRMHADVRDTVREAARAGTRVEVLAARIGERYAVSESRARLIARDQILKANSDLTRVRQTSAGITRYKWSTSHDERVRGTPGGRWPKGLHAALDGQVFSWDDPPVANPNGSKAHPGVDFQCRCVAIPVLGDD